MSKLMQDLDSCLLPQECNKSDENELRYCKTITTVIYWTPRTIMYQVTSERKFKAYSIKEEKLRNKEALFFGRNKQLTTSITKHPGYIRSKTFKREFN